MRMVGSAVDREAVLLRSDDTDAESPDMVRVGMWLEAVPHRTGDQVPRRHLYHDARPPAKPTAAPTVE